MSNLNENNDNKEITKKKTKERLNIKIIRPGINLPSKGSGGRLLNNCFAADFPFPLL